MKKILIFSILIFGLIINLLPLLAIAQIKTGDFSVDPNIVKSNIAVPESTGTSSGATPQVQADPGVLPPQDITNQGNNNITTPPASTDKPRILVLPDPLNLNTDISKAPGQLVTRITNIFLGLIGIGALVVIIYGGSLYLFSMGDNKKAEKGRKVLEYAIIGLAIILGAYIIINTALSVLTQVTK